MSTLTIILLCTLVLTFLTPFAMCWYDHKFKKHTSCTYFGWHNGNGGSDGFDGASFTARCSKCNSAVMQDSQGNWF